MLLFNAFIDCSFRNKIFIIYRKDQINEDKRKLRLLKERYLEDGEFHQDKGFRKKQFRWKNLNGKL